MNSARLLTLIATALTWAACTTSDTVELGGRGDAGSSVADPFDARPGDAGDLSVGTFDAGTPDVRTPDGRTPDSGPSQPGADRAPLGPDSGLPPEPCGGTTGTICDDGRECAFSGDCNVGSICNSSDDPYYDPASPADVCMRLVCANDGECTNGRSCSAERTCGAPVCQSAADCGGDEICTGGLCALSAAVPVSCEIVTIDGAVTPGRSLRLVARAITASGDVLGSAGFLWASSAPNRVMVSGDLATGGSEPGVAEISAALATSSTIACSGLVRIENVTPAVAPALQVRVVEAATGFAVSGARVIVLVDGIQQEQVTSAAGTVVFTPVTGVVGWVTVLSAGHGHVSVMSPGTRDLLVPLDPAPTPERAGGFRGAVDVSASTVGDLYVGLAGAALPLDLSRFRLSMLLGDPLDTVIDAPQLGLSQQAMTLPGNLMLRLGSDRYTVDRAGPDLRCQGLDPSPTELGCFVARAPAGRTVAWTLATRLRLIEIAAIAGRISGLLGDGFDVIDVLPEIVPIMRTAPSGVDATLLTTTSPRVDRVSGQPSAACSDPSTAGDESLCRADFARYAPVHLTASTRRLLHTAVTVPRLPAVGGDEPEAVLVVAAAASPYGLVPLGIGAGRDSESSPDGLVEGVTRPFGQFSNALPAGQVALSSAGPHSGLEGLPVRVLAVAYDRAPDVATGERISGLITTPATLGPSLDFGGRSFLGYATGLVDRASATFVGTVPGGATMLTLELVRGGRSWRIHAPAGTTTLTLPAVMEARVDLLAGATAPEVSLQVIRAINATYADLLTRGSAAGLSTLDRVTDAFSRQRCVESATGVCRVQ